MNDLHHFILSIFHQKNMFELCSTLLRYFSMHTCMQAKIYAPVNDISEQPLVTCVCVCVFL